MKTPAKLLCASVLSIQYPSLLLRRNSRIAMHFTIKAFSVLAAVAAVYAAPVSMSLNDWPLILESNAQLEHHDSL